MTDTQLDGKALEAAAQAIADDDVLSYEEIAQSAITAYLSALPPRPSASEAVAWMYDDDGARYYAKDEYEADEWVRQGANVIPLYASPTPLSVDREKDSKPQQENTVSEKTLGNTDVNGARKNVADLVVFGNGDAFKLFSKASSQSEGWMKSTKVLNVPTGCVVQVTTQQRNPDGTYAVAEALTFVPNVTLIGEGETRRFIHDGLKDD